MNQWGKVTHVFGDGVWAVDVDHLWKVFYDSARTENYLKAPYLTIERLDTGWTGPAIFNRNINFDAAAKDAAASADCLIAGICYDITAGKYTAASLRARVEAELQALDALRDSVTDAALQNGRNNAESLRSNVSMWENAITVAKFTRDGSSMALAVGGTILSGGAIAAGVGFMATGSALTGVATAQDCEHSLTFEQAVGVAMVSGTLDFTTSVISLGVGPLTKGMGTGGKLLVSYFTKVPVKTVSSFAVAEIEREPGEAHATLSAHAWKTTKSWAADETIGKLLEAGPVKKMVRGIILPIATSIKSYKGDLKGAFASKMVKGVAAKGTNAAATTGFAALVKAGTDRSPLPASVVRQPVHGGSDVNRARLNAILSPLQSFG